MKLLLSAVLYVLLACSFSVPGKVTTRVFTLKDFGEPITLQGKTVPLAGVTFPTSIIIMPEKNVLMFLESSSVEKKKHLQVYSLDSLKFIRKLIDQGPNGEQMLYPSNLQYDNRNGGEVYVTDSHKRQIFVYKADSLIAGKEHPFRVLGKPFDGHTYVVDSENLFMRPVVINRNHDFIGVRTSMPNPSQTFFNKYRDDSSLKDSFDVYPKTGFEIHSPMQATIFNGQFALSDDKKNILYSFFNVNKLVIYDTNGKIIASAIGPVEIGPSVKSQKTGNGEEAVSLDLRTYGGSCIHKELVYALYSGESIESGYHTTTLLQFTSTLQPKKRYKFDTPVYNLGFDWRTKRIYAFNAEGSVKKLVVFQM